LVNKNFERTGGVFAVGGANEIKNEK